MPGPLAGGRGGCVDCWAASAAAAAIRRNAFMTQYDIKPSAKGRQGMAGSHSISTRRRGEHGGQRGENNRLRVFTGWSVPLLLANHSRIMHMYAIQLPP